jgi:hypothetical protein
MLPILATVVGSLLDIVLGTSAYATRRLVATIVNTDSQERTADLFEQLSCHNGYHGVRRGDRREGERMREMTTREDSTLSR